MKVISFLFCLVMSLDDSGAQPPSDRHHIDSLNALANSLRFKDEDQLLKLAETALSQSEELSYTYGELQAKNNLGAYYALKGRPEEALNKLISCHYVASEILSSEPDLSNEYRRVIAHEAYASARLAAHVLGVQGLYDKQKEFFELAKEFLLKTDYTEYQLRVLKTMEGTMYKDMGLYDEAIIIYKDLLSFFQNDYKPSDSYNKKVFMADVFCLLTESYLEKGDFQMALRYNNEAMTLAEETNKPSIITLCYGVIADILGKNENYDSALQIADLALNFAQTQGDSAFIYRIKGKSYVQLDDLEKAEMFLRQAFDIEMFLKRKKKSSRVAEDLKLLYQKMGDESKLADIHQISDELNTELAESKLSSILQKLQDREGQNLDRRLAFEKNTGILISIFGGLSIVLFIMLLLLKKRTRMHEKMKQ